MAAKAGSATEAQDRGRPRSDPQQERSRTRQQALLDAAEEIIGEVGADGLKMREVGRRANLPIASVYHYFPSASAIIRVLVERMLEDLRGILTESLERTAGASGDAIEQGLLATIDAAADFMESRPTLPAVWGAMRGAPELRALDVADTQRNAEILAPAIRELLPSTPADEAQALALVLLEGVSSILLLGCQLPKGKRAKVRRMLKEFVAAAMAGMREANR